RARAQIEIDARSDEELAQLVEGLRHRGDHGRRVQAAKLERAPFDDDFAHPGALRRVGAAHCAAIETLAHARQDPPSAPRGPTSRRSLARPRAAHSGRRAPVPMKRASRRDALRVMAGSIAAALAASSATSCAPREADGRVLASLWFAYGGKNR